MRELSPIEKDIVKKLCEEGHTICTLLEGHLDGNILIIDKNQDILGIAFKRSVEIPGGYDSASYSEVTKIVELIATVLNFIGYLKDNYYIYCTELAYARLPVPIIGDESIIDDYNKNPSEYPKYGLPDKEIRTDFLNNLDKFYFATEGLQVFYKNDYQTDEQKRFKATSRRTYIAIIITFLIGIAGISISISSLRKPTTINEKQFNSIHETFDSLNMEVKEINKNLEQLIIEQDSIINTKHDPSK